MNKYFLVAVIIFSGPFFSPPAYAGVCEDKLFKGIVGAGYDEKAVEEELLTYLSDPKVTKEEKKRAMKNVDLIRESSKFNQLVALQLYFECRGLRPPNW